MLSLSVSLWRKFSLRRLQVWIQSARLIAGHRRFQTVVAIAVPSDASGEKYAKPDICRLQAKSMWLACIETV